MKTCELCGFDSPFHSRCPNDGSEMQYAGERLSACATAVGKMGEEIESLTKKHHDAELRCLDLAKRLTAAENENASARRTLEAFGCQKLGDAWVAPGKSVEGSLAWYRHHHERLENLLTEKEERLNTDAYQIGTHSELQEALHKANGMVERLKREKREGLKTIHEMQMHIDELNSGNERAEFKANLTKECADLRQVIADCPLHNPEHSMGDERNWTARAKQILAT